MRFAEIQLVDKRAVSSSTTITDLDDFEEGDSMTKRLLLFERRITNILVVWLLPTTIDQTGNKSCAEAVVDINDRYV